MRVIESKTGRRTGTLLFVVNTLPIAGLIGFGWRPFQALFVYWVEIGVTLLGYYVVVLFGQRDSKPEEKGGGSYPGPVPLPVPDGSFRPIRSLPPLRTETRGISLLLSLSSRSSGFFSRVHFWISRTPGS